MVQALEAMTYRGHQERTDYTPSGSSPGVGKTIDLGTLFGVVTTPEGLVDGRIGSLAITGAFKLKKTPSAGITFAKTAVIYWDAGNATATGNSSFPKWGLADEAAVDADDHVKGILNGVAVQ